MRNRVVAVIVALGATHRQSQKGGGNDLDGVRDTLVSRLDCNRAFSGGAIGSHAQETGGHQFFPRGGGQVLVRRPQHLILIAGQLLLNELIEWFVLVERLDHVITILVRIETDPVAGIAVGVGVAGHVEPVAAPALAVARGVEQAVQQAFVGIGGRISQKAVGFFRRGR